MASLAELNQAKATLKQIGVDTSAIDDQIKQAEENIIKNEILPLIEDDIAPLLKDVQRELVLVVDYKPGEPIRLHMSRRSNLGEILKKQGAMEIVQDPQAEHGRHNKHAKGVQTFSSELEVIFPDGKTIAEQDAATTLEKVVRIIGVTRVRDVVKKLNLKFAKVPVISNTQDDQYSKFQRDLGDGWLLMTLCQTKTKANFIDIVSQELGLGLKAIYTEHKKNGEDKPLDTEQDTTKTDGAKQRMMSSLSVKFPDGTCFDGKNATATFEQAVRRIGAARVKTVVDNHDLRYAYVPIIATEKNKKYGYFQREMGDGLFLLTNMHNKEKADLLKFFSRELNLGLVVKYTEHPKTGESKSENNPAVISNDEDGKKKSPPFRFSMVGIDIGEEVTFNPTGQIMKVASDNTVEYEGKTYKLSQATSKFMPDNLRIESDSYRGPLFFSYKGQTLQNLREIAEGKI